MPINNRPPVPKEGATFDKQKKETFQASLFDSEAQKITPNPPNETFDIKQFKAPSGVGLSQGLGAVESEQATPPLGAGGLNHTLIEGDNLHALTTLTFTNENKIDVIYIDPPYNTGNKDFKYNDSFVDKEDSYRHSKWLSFMDKRL